MPDSRPRHARPVPGPTQPLPRWTVPYAGSTYPVSLAADGTETRGVGPKVYGAMGVLVALSAYFVVVSLVNVLVLRIGFAVEARGEDFTTYLRAGQGFANVGGLVAAHLALGALIAVVVGMLAWLHRRRPAWLWSVSPGVRWRYLVACLLVALVVFTVVLLIRGIPPWHPQDRVVVFLVAIVLTSPLQAIAEEALFRGYLVQALGLVVRRDWFPILAQALLFALFHGTQNAALFLDRFAFGVLAALLVRETGGLEAGIAAHIVNNLMAFGIAALTTSVAAARAITQLTWGDAAIDVTGFAVVAAGCWWVARRMRVPDRVA